MDHNSTDSHPLHFILPAILAELTHLDLSGRVVFSESKVVGGGAYGDISKAYCTLPGRGKVGTAIKRLRFYLKEDIKSLFEKEIYVWSKLKHPNVLPLLGFAFDNLSGYPLLVSEWMDKGSAWAYVNSEPECDLMRLITGIAEGLAYLHTNGVVHSDIKSDNVLVSDSGDALICDFGCARMVASSRSLANLSSGIKGTTRYLACELLSRESESTGYSEKTDVWAFGMTVFELLARERPYNHLREAQVSSAIVGRELPSLPPSTDSWTSCSSEAREMLWSICQLCWIHNPASRADMSFVLMKLRQPQTRTRVLSKTEPASSDLFRPRSTDKAQAFEHSSLS